MRTLVLLVVQLLWKMLWRFLDKIKKKATIRSSNLTSWCIYPKESKMGLQRGICTSLFFAALFTIAKRRKQPKCASGNG